MPFETMTYEVVDNVAVITLNRPDDANALNLPMAEELFEVAVKAEHDPNVRAVLITGTGKMFCAGGDLKHFAEAGDEMAGRLTKTATGLHAAVSHFNRMDAPVVVAVNGTAAGAGFSIAICGDYVFASDRAKFTMAYTAAGLSPDGSSTFFLAQLVGMRRAKELALTNRLLSAEEAFEWGMVNKVVAGDDLQEEAMGLAKKFAKGPTKSFGMTKRLILEACTESLETQMEAEGRGIAECCMTADGQEGVTAFLEKRKPDFKGA